MPLILMGKILMHPNATPGAQTFFTGRKINQLNNKNKFK